MAVVQQRKFPHFIGLPSIRHYTSVSDDIADTATKMKLYRKLVGTTEDRERDIIYNYLSYQSKTSYWDLSIFWYYISCILALLRPFFQNMHRRRFSNKVRLVIQIG